MRLILAAALGLSGVAATAQVSDDTTVRVHLFAAAPPPEVTVEVVGQPAALTADGSVVATLTAGDRVDLRRRGGLVLVRHGAQEVSARHVRLDAAEVRVRGGSADRRYAGALAAVVQGQTLLVVNHVPMDRYVASVVGAELNFPELEALKAQAVLARTYAARRAGRHLHHDLADDQTAQVYRGIGSVTETSRRATEETYGEVLTYYGALADAYYFSSSGGHTADNEAIWDGTPVPYLRGVADPFDAAAPDHSWRTSGSRPSVLRELSARYGGAVRGIEIERRSRSGRVLRVRLDGAERETISGSQFRRAVNAAVGRRTVRSTKFDVWVEGDRYVFAGGGFGHGVGMSQYGALGQSRAGRDYREILSFYFAGTVVSGGAAPQLAVRDRPTPRSAQPVGHTPPPAAGTQGAAVPREPSALRTRYRPTSARSRPTPRRLTRDQVVDVAPGRPVLRREAPPASRPAPRRTAW